MTGRFDEDTKRALLQPRLDGMTPEQLLRVLEVNLFPAGNILCRIPLPLPELPRELLWRLLINSSQPYAAEAIAIATAAAQELVERFPEELGMLGFVKIIPLAREPWGDAAWELALSRHPTCIDLWWILRNAKSPNKWTELAFELFLRTPGALRQAGINKAEIAAFPYGVRLETWMLEQKATESALLTASVRELPTAELMKALGM